MSDPVLTSFVLADEDETVALGKKIAKLVNGRGIIFLEGTLGAGKTTFARGVLAQFEYSGAVKSPTYTLVESYSFDMGRVNHFDLYRLGEAEELEFIGIRDYFETEGLSLIEWPERGSGYLPRPDIVIRFDVIKNGRLAKIQGLSDLGSAVIKNLEES